MATAIDPARPNYPPDAWLKREQWSAPVLVDGDGSVADAYGLSAFPYWVAVDREGKVVMRATGELAARAARRPRGSRRPLTSGSIDRCAPVPDVTGGPAGWLWDGGGRRGPMGASP